MEWIVNVLIFTPEEIHKWKDSTNHVIARSSREGGSSMTDREDSQRMLAVAEIDLKALGNMLDPDMFDKSVFGFYIQQPVEKTLEACFKHRT